MLLTPTYHVFEMYKVHQEAELLPIDVNCGEYKFDDKKLPALNVSASKNNGSINITLVNIDPGKGIALTIDIRGYAAKNVTGQILTSPEITDLNTFENPEKVKPAEFNNVKISKGILSVSLPAKSIILLEIK